MIRYRDNAAGLRPAQLAGFFEGWPNPPDPDTRLRILEGSAHVVIAVDEETDAPVGFITAITDGVLAAYIPLLEVLPPFRGRGIGRELARRMLDTLAGLYMIDLVCDADVMPFYEKLGMKPFTAMVRRNFDAQSGRRAGPS